MKTQVLTLLLLILTGCSLSSKHLVDSPSAEGGQEHRFHYAHGGVQPGSPNESLILRARTDTATALTVMARPVRWKPTWMGIIFPIFPVHFLPTAYYYRDSVTRLEINLWVRRPDSVAVDVDSIRLLVDGSSHAPASIVPNDEWKTGFPPRPGDPSPFKRDSTAMPWRGFQLRFPVPGDSVSDYSLKVTARTHAGREIGFPVIRFQRKWQKYFAGPP